MFVQVMQGPCSDVPGIRRIMDRWQDELAPGSIGWLGTTAGVTDDGQFIGIARFASEEQARANSDRPEQGAWWGEFTKYIDGDITVRDCPTSDVFLAGGSNDAGFVQVIQYDVTDLEAARAAMAAMEKMSAAETGRPDLIGGTVAWHSDEDGLTQVAYFTSEEEARQNESQEPPEEIREMFASFDAAFTNPRYLDLREPWLISPR